ncbi:MAG: CoA pyrophosphatase [Bacteroidota bacterium]
MAPLSNDEHRFNSELRKKARKGAVLILFYPHLDSTYFPLIQRPLYDGVHSGQIALPGGKMEVNDRDLVDTALREASEEIGVDTSRIRVLGELTKLFIPVSNFDVLPVVACMDAKMDFVPDNHEVEEVVNARLDHLLDDKTKGVSEIVVGGSFTLKAPSFSVEGKVVWGATAMILSELVMIFKNR